MKRRTAIFGLFWAFAVNAFWVPGGLDENYIVSVCFPAWPLFLMGLTIGTIHEMLAKRWLRIGVSVAMIATLTQLCLAIFGGHTDGFYLALPMAEATILGSIAAALPRLTQLRIVPYLGYLLLAIAACASFGIFLSLVNWRPSTIKETVSPNGVYTAQVRETFGMKSRNPPPDVVVGPRRDIAHLFWASIGSGSNVAWSGNQSLYTQMREHSEERRRYLNVRTTPKKF